ncbi:hypothetical protein RXV88_04165 [Aestuariicoccus sp. MJ-SS9]|nr:hypothetical protein [Aestuariicoccus sp. MJ-SS9]MDU8910460.1 hypothetical protein [Aestuariicoccus sp. MJ-SS9]
MHGKFDEQYQRARVDQMHSWANQIVHLADDAEGDFKITVPLDSPELQRIEKKGAVTFKFDGTHVNRARLSIDTRKFLMARYAPETFGTHSTVQINPPLDHKSDEELVQDLRDALQEAGMTTQELVELLDGGEQALRGL